MPFRKKIISFLDVAQKSLFKWMISLLFSHPQRHLSLVATQAIKKSHYLACCKKHQLHHLPSPADVTPPESVSNMAPSKGQLRGCAHMSAGQATALLYTCPYYSCGPLSGSELSF